MLLVVLVRVPQVRYVYLVAWGSMGRRDGLGRTEDYERCDAVGEREVFV